MKTVGLCSTLARGIISFVRNYAASVIALALFTCAAPIASAAPWFGSLKISTASPLPNAAQSKPCSVTFSASGGKIPYRWATTASLPPGLSFSTAGVLSGTPITPATYSIGIVVVDSKNQSKAASFTLTVQPASAPPLVILPQTLPSGMVGKPYDYQIQIQGGTPPYHCDPDPTNNLAEFGLALGSDCKLSGTPIKPGSVHF